MHRRIATTFVEDFVQRTDLRRLWAVTTKTKTITSGFIRKASPSADTRQQSSTGREVVDVRYRQPSLVSRLELGLWFVGAEFAVCVMTETSIAEAPR